MVRNRRATKPAVSRTSLATGGQPVGALGWRAAARDLSLLFCAALAAYLISVLLAARLGLWLVGVAAGEHSAALRLLLGTLVVDFSKAPGLLLLALGLRRVLQIGPTAAALALLGFCYLLELLTWLALGQSSSAFEKLPVLLSRLAAMLLLFAAVRWILGLRSRRTL